MMQSDAREYVIVTGAAGGIGRQLVQDLVKDGVRVVAVDMSEVHLARLVDELGESVLPVAADLTDSSGAELAVHQAVTRWGLPMGLVNLAGNNIIKPMEELTDDEWHFLIDVNLSSTFFMCRAVLPHLRKRGGGRIVNISSIFGLRGERNDAAYSAAKAGVVGLTRAMATEFASEGILVNNVAPVATLTERVARMPESHLSHQLARIPLGRFSDVTDVTRTVCWLLSPDTGYYTGQTFSPNGGDLMP